MPHRGQKIHGKIVLQDDEVRWVIKLIVGESFYFECVDGSGRVMFSTEWEEHRDIKLLDVEVVYDNLQVLVDGISERFPAVRNVAQTIARFGEKFD